MSEFKTQKTNTELLTIILQTTITNSIPLDKARMEKWSYNNVINLEFDYQDLTPEELRNLKRCCNFQIDGPEDGNKSLVGEIGPHIRVRVSNALKCRKVTAEEMTLAEMEDVVKRFRSGDSYIIDCEVPKLEVEVEDLA